MEIGEVCTRIIPKSKCAVSEQEIFLEKGEKIPCIFIIAKTEMNPTVGNLFVNFNSAFVLLCVSN